MSAVMGMRQVGHKQLVGSSPSAPSRELDLYLAEAQCMHGWYVPRMAHGHVTCLLPVPGVVDICLIPEIEFDVQEMLEYTKRLVAKKGHAVICVAEGAGQALVQVCPTGCSV